LGNKDERNDKECSKNAENGFAFRFSFFERHNKDSNSFVNQIVWVTGDENWGLFVNTETK
jgi:hypothetical protein